MLDGRFPQQYLVYTIKPLMLRQLSLVAVDQMPEKENRLKDNSVYSIQGTKEFVISNILPRAYKRCVSPTYISH
jgi:hypothetical protein